MEREFGFNWAMVNSKLGKLRWATNVLVVVNRLGEEQ